jgi:cell division protein FtsW (lipid II flippase)
MTVRGAPDVQSVLIGGRELPATTTRREPLEFRLYRAYGYVLGWLLVGYLFLDRGFAHFHLPKLKVFFVGEMTLALGLIAVLFGTRWLVRAIARDAVIGTMLGFMLWGVLRALPNVHKYGYQAVVRDSALWYYGGFALAFLAAATAVPDLPRKLIRGFRRVVPWLSLWGPVGLLLQRSGVKGPNTRISGVPLLSHRPGDFCCVAVLCLAFLLLVPQGPGQNATGGDRLIVRGFRPPVFALLISLNFLTIVLGATQTRGGGFAALVATIMIFVFMDRRRRSGVLITIMAAAMIVVALAVVTGATYHTTKRSVSVSQLFENAQSVLGGGKSSGGGAQLQGSVNFRTTLWSNVLDTESSTGHLEIGFGFGPNLAEIGGLTQKAKTSAAAEQLRSAHNSLLDVLARTGIIGSIIFVLFWAGWLRRMGRTRKRTRDDDDTRGVVGVCIVTSVAIFINCFFDPTLEGAQTAAVLYTLFAIGILCSRGPINREPRPAPAIRVPRANLNERHAIPA